MLRSMKCWDSVKVVMVRKMYNDVSQYPEDRGRCPPLCDACKVTQLSERSLPLVGEEGYGDITPTRLVLNWRFQRGNRRTSRHYILGISTRAPAIITSSHSPPRRERPRSSSLGFFVIFAILAAPLLPFLFGRIIGIKTFIRVPSPCIC